MTDAPDTTTMTGAEFMRHVGTDAAKWAEAMLDANRCGAVASSATDWPPWPPEQIALIARWFRDYAEVKVAEALRGEADSACPQTS